MNELMNFISENPQVSASFITAVFGILGIFINIIINIVFRKNDYKNKNKMKQIENMDLYYLPLLEKIENTISVLQNINKKGGEDLYAILDGKMGAEHDGIVKVFKDSLLELNLHFNSDNYKFQNNYRLFKKHRKVKIIVDNLEKYIISKTKDLGDTSSKKFLDELVDLSMKIRYCAAKIMTSNFISRIWECLLIFKNSKKK